MEIFLQLAYGVAATRRFDRAERVLFSRQNAQPSHQGELRKRNFACRGGRIAPIASFFHRELTVSAFVMSDSFQTVPRLTSE